MDSIDARFVEDASRISEASHRSLPDGDLDVLSRRGDWL